MADLDITGRVTVDASQAEGAFDRVGQRAGQMSDAVAGAATRAGDAVGRIGAGSEAGEQTLTRSQSRIRDQIIRSTEAIENLGKTASQKLEIKIATQGLDPNIYAPYLARLREVEAAQAALRASGREAAAGAEEAGSAFDLLASKLAGFNVSAKDALVGLAAGFSAGAFVGWIKGAIDSADAASKLASSAGLAVEELAGLQLAFEGADAGNQLQSTLSKLASEAQKGNTAFAAMGIAVTNSSGGLKSTRDLLAEVSDKFAGYRDGAEKTALAQQLLGESGAALIPLFNGGSAALDEFDESAKALGLTLSTEAAEAAGNFNDQIDLITQRSQGLARQLASELLPVLSTISEQFGSAAKQGSSFSLIGTGLSVVLETITVVGSDVAFVLRTIARDATLVFNSAVKLATLDFSGIKSGFAAYQAETTDARKALDQFQAAIVTARAVATAGDLDEPWVKRARMEAQQAAEAAKALAPQISAVATARGANRKAIDGETAALKARLAAATSANTAFDEEFKTIEAARLATEARIKTGRELLQSIERETAMLGLSNTEREQAIALFALERAGVVAGTEAYEAFAVSIRDAVNARGDKQALTDAVAATKAAEDQLAQFGLLKSEVQALTLARMEDARESAALAGEDVANIQKRIEEQKKLVAATRGIEIKEVSKKAADEAKAEWEKTADSINSSLTDALMRGFEDGKGFAKNLRDTLVNMFKTMVLRPTISAILAPVAGALSGTANAAGGGGGGGLLSGANSLSSIYSAVSGGVTSGIAGGAIKLGGMLGSSTLTSFGAGMAGATTPLAAGLAGPVLPATGAAGMGAAFAAAMPWLLGAVAVASLWKPLFGRKLKDSGIEGTFGGDTGFEGNSFEFLKGGVFRSDKTNRNPLDEATRAGIADAFIAVRDQVGEFADALGLQSDKLVGYTSAIKLSLKGLSAEDAQKKIAEALAIQSDAMATAILGVTQSGFNAERYLAENPDVAANAFYGKDPERHFEDFGRVEGRMAEIGKSFAKSGETASQTLARLATSLITVNSVFDALGKSALSASLDGADLASQLVDAFGGMDQFAAASSSYFEAFYSEQERTDAGLRRLTGALGEMGLALPDATASGAIQQYRALVDAQDTNTEAGRKAYAALVTLGSGFAQIAEAVSATTKALKTEGANLQVGLLRAQGDDTGANAAQRALDTLDFTAAEIALYDYNEALRDQIKVATEATGLQDRLYAATDTTAQAAARARAAIDPLNQALYDTVIAAEAAKAAAETQKGFAEKYAAPITATSAAATLGPDVMASLAGKSAEQIRAMALVYVASLDSQTEAGRAAIAAFDKLTPSIDFFVDSAAGMVDAAGISAEAIGEKFRDVILGQTGPEEAGKAISKMVTDGIYNSLANGFTQQITQIMVGQLITPMIQAAVAGTSISAAVSQSAIDSMLAAAKNASAVLGQLMSSDEFKNLIAGVSTVVGEATQSLVLPVTALLPAADAAANSVDKLNKSLGRFGDTLDLRADLLDNVAAQGPRPTLSVNAGAGAFLGGIRGEGATTARAVISEWLDAEADAIEGYVADTERIVADARARLADPVYAIALEQYLQNFDADARGTATGLYARNFATGAAAFTQFFDDLGDFGETLAGQLATANDTAIGSALNLVAIGEYFAGLGTEIANIQAGLANAATMAGGGLSLDAATSGFATSIGGAATDIAAAINASIIAGIPEAIRNDPALAGLSTSLMAAVGSVGQGDVQGLNDSFLLLSGALTRGELSAVQYAAAIDHVLDSFANGADAASAAAESVADAYARLRNIVKSNEDIARERITLEDQYAQLTSTTAQLRATELAALDPSNRALQLRIWAIEDEKTALEALSTATDNAFAALERAVEAQRKTINTQIEAAQSLATEVGSIFDSLKSAVGDLYRSVDSTAQQSAAQARAFIANALSGALATGSLPESKALADAISAARGGLDSQQFATQFESDRARLVLAGELSQLQEIAGTQLTEAQRQIRLLEDQLETLERTLQTARDQIDVMRGVDKSVLSVADAVAALGVTLAAELQAVAAAAAAATRAASPAMQPYALTDSGALRQEKVEAQTGVALSAGDSPMVAAAKMLYQSINGGANTADFNRVAAGVGGDIASALGWDGSREGAEALRDKYSFAVGINRVPFDMTARVHKDEAIVPAAFNPFNPGARKNGMGGNTDRLESLIEGLTNRVQALQTELVAIKTNTGQMAEQIDEVTEGGNAMRQRAVGVAA